MLAGPGRGVADFQRISRPVRHLGRLLIGSGFLPDRWGVADAVLRRGFIQLVDDVGIVLETILIFIDELGSPAGHLGVGRGGGLPVRSFAPFADTNTRASIASVRTLIDRYNMLQDS